MQNTKTKELISEAKILEYVKALESPEGTIYASDTKFHRLFGRDSVITSLEFLPWFPKYAKSTILSLSAFQKENGQILHETVKEDTMWDSIDSTPLFLILISEYVKKTKDYSFAKQLFPRINSALKCIETEVDKDSDGLLEYFENAKGLNHHCWKDSHDGMINEDGSIPKYPIAPVETQGYLYKAYLGIAEIFEEIELEKEAEELKDKAEDLKKKFNELFYVPEQNFYAIGIDGDKKPITTISSNIGHVLWCGIIDDDKVDQVVKRLLQDDIFTPYGLRTLSDKMGNFDHMSYHNGNIWPFDNWFFVEALGNYGYSEEANTLRKNVLDGLALLESPYECYTFLDGKLGTDLHTWDEKELYPEKIQAWTLGAMYSFLKKLKRL